MKHIACLVGLTSALVCIAPSGGVAQCPGDFNDDGIVSTSELVTAVNNALNGCPVSGQRFVDNRDGTITDRQTGLMWETKNHLDGVPNATDPHDADNEYSWSRAGRAPNGTIFTDFLPALNGCVSADGIALTGGFAEHCDWRLPSISELATLTLAPYPCESSPCIDPIFGATQTNSGYWSNTPNATHRTLVWNVIFEDGLVAGAGIPTEPSYVRAVRGGL